MTTANSQPTTECSHRAEHKHALTAAGERAAAVRDADQHTAGDLLRQIARNLCVLADRIEGIRNVHGAARGQGENSDG